MGVSRHVRRVVIMMAAVLVAMVPCLWAASAPAATATAPESDRGEMMLVLDSSGSMAEPASGGTTKIDAAKDSLNTVVDDLPSDAPVGLRVYGAEVEFRNQAGACTDSQRVVDIGTDNRDELHDAVASYRPFGETPIGYALEQAAKDLGSEGKRTIVLVSDGEPTCKPNPCKVAAELAEDGIDMRIDVVGLDVSGKARKALSCIAAKGNGTYYDADDADGLTDALSTVSERAAKPYEAIGTPVTGGPGRDQAAEITAGDWLDTLGGPKSDTGQRWYRFKRTVPKSTIHVSATIANPTGEDALHLRVYAGQTECGFAQGQGPATYRPFVVAAVAAPGFNEFEDECVNAGELTIMVQRGAPNGGFAKNSDVPVEIRAIEEAPATNAKALPGRLEERAEKKPSMSNPTDIVGGNTFGNAVEVEPGAYSGTLVPGEAQLFEIDADWGQRVNAAVDFPKPDKALADAIGSYGPAPTLWIYSPSRATASSAFHSAQQSILSSSSTTDLYGHSYPIGYNNRQSFVDAQSAASIAGKYYISVSVARDEDSKASYEIPFTLGVDVEGKTSNVPEYDGGEPQIGESESDDSTTDDPTGSSDDIEQTAAGTDDTDGPWLAVALGVGGIVLLGLGAAMVRVARR
ncbi:vWA domain-containing protein [Solicola gregarius]|uniref:VWA domain-containing protein n=1 Tax=Solicola gregarius TaxID=2908642 RepID=A0AA46TF15_9ACTN|nr:VWA domain-containing protein [Solicola gregarius]UYM03993.1 VWA domain-containing protein [Solicola gregarius]